MNPNPQQWHNHQPTVPPGYVSYAMPLPHQRRTPLVRNWFTPAMRTWTHALYPRGSFFIAFGCLFFVTFAFLWVKFMVWASVAGAMAAAFVITASVDLATYPVRKRKS